MESFPVKWRSFFSFSLLVLERWVSPHGTTQLNWNVSDYFCDRSMLTSVFTFSLLDCSRINCFLFGCASNRIHRVQRSTECFCWVSLDVSKIYGKWCWIMNYLWQLTYAMFYLFFYIFFTSAWLINLVGRCMRGFIFIHASSSSPRRFWVAGEATLMILISQTAWIQTGILPLPLQVSIWCSSPSLPCLSFSLFFSVSFSAHPLLLLRLASSFSPSSSPFVFCCSPSSRLTLCAGK